MKITELKKLQFAALILIIFGVFLGSVFGLNNYRTNALILNKKTDAEQLYQRALRIKNANTSPDRRFRIMAEYCHQIIEKHSDSPQAEMAKQLLQEIPGQYQGLHVEEAPLCSDISGRQSSKTSSILRNKLPESQLNNQALERLEMLTQEEMRANLREKSLKLPSLPNSLRESTVPHKK